MIIICNKPGQLGNRLFVFSHFIAFAKEHNLKILNPAFDEYSSYFKGSSSSSIASFPVSWSSSVRKSHYLRHLHYLFFSFLSRLAHRLKLNNRLVSSVYLDWHEEMDLGNISDRKAFNSKLCLVQGWNYRSEELFFKHKKDILKYFEPVAEHQKRIDDFLSEVKGPGSMLIGIHIRRGDYKTFEGGKYYFEDQAYISVMLKINELFPERKCIFVICSNEPIDLQKFREAKLNVHKGPDHELQDLYVLGSCNYIAGPPSTYTMWASAFNQVPLFTIRTSEPQISLENFSISGNNL